MSGGAALSTPREHLINITSSLMATGQAVATARLAILDADMARPLGSLLAGVLRPLWYLSLPELAWAIQGGRCKRRGGQARPPRRDWVCGFTQAEARPMCVFRGSQGDRSRQDIDRTKSKQLLPRQSALHMHIECIVRAGDACVMKL